jgi:D-amino-acid dehydrogenase
VRDAPGDAAGTPVLGATTHANLCSTSGHGALGFTLALATGRIVADLAAGRTPAIPLDGFTLH